MGINSRLKKIEIATQSKRVDIGSLKLFDSSMKAVDGEVITMPTAESEGLARLADGTEKAIIYESNWKNELVVFRDDDAQNTDDKLRIRKADIPVIVTQYVDISNFPKAIET